MRVGRVRLAPLRELNSKPLGLEVIREWDALRLELLLYLLRALRRRDHHVFDVLLLLLVVLRALLLGALPQELLPLRNLIRGLPALHETLELRRLDHARVVLIECDPQRLELGDRQLILGEVQRAPNGLLQLRILKQPRAIVINHLEESKPIILIPALILHDLVYPLIELYREKFRILGAQGPLAHCLNPVGEGELRGIALDGPCELDKAPQLNLLDRVRLVLVDHAPQLHDLILGELRVGHLELLPDHSPQVVKCQHTRAIRTNHLPERREPCDALVHIRKVLLDPLAVRDRKHLLLELVLDGNAFLQELGLHLRRWSR